MTDYNYRTFPLDMEEADFAAFPGALEVGQRAPNGDLVDAASGESLRLSGLWRSGPAVLEFGSIT